MEFEKVLAFRQSTRSFTEEKVSEKGDIDLDTLIEKIKELQSGGYRVISSTFSKNLNLSLTAIVKFCVLVFIVRLIKSGSFTPSNFIDTKR